MGFYENVIFPWVLDHIEGPELAELRERTVRGARGEVLEVGFGTGGNLPFYGSDVASIAAVEPAEGMNRRARSRIAGSRIAVNLVSTAGERLPFEAASFDTVVMTITLCTVSDPAQVLREVRRVLRPGGSYRFFEHVASATPRARGWQERLNGLSRIIGCGCNLNRDTEASIRDAGFTLREIEHLNSAAMPIPALYPVIVGVAT